MLMLALRILSLCVLRQCCFVQVYDEDENTLTLALRIQSLSDEDYGQYECVSQNLLGSDSETMILYGRALTLWLAVSVVSGRS